jgi:hypothetical protein
METLTDLLMVIETESVRVKDNSLQYYQAPVAHICNLAVQVAETRRIKDQSEPGQIVRPYLEKNYSEKKG